MTTNIVGLFTKTIQSFQYIFGIADRYSEFAQTVAIPYKTAANVANLF